MPRQARIDAPGALHHILIRGIEGTAIFKSDEDRGNFIERLSHLLTESQPPCYAWALMTNHIHLLLRTGWLPIAAIMRRLLTGYAVSFNRRHSRHGHLFQNRYNSVLCKEDRYLRQLVAYIHLNPFRAGIVRDVAGLRAYRVINAVCRYFGIREKELAGPSRRFQVANARALIGYMATPDLPVSGSDVARRLNIDRSAACRAVQRLRYGAKLTKTARAIWEVLNPASSQQGNSVPFCVPSQSGKEYTVS
jgi:REP element-mobilizing transposase RayT